MKHTIAHCLAAGLLGLAALPQLAMSASLPYTCTGTSRYTATGAEVLDPRYKLIWQRCEVGQTWNGTTCTGSATLMDHEAALNYARLNSGTLGWRLPDVKELSASLMDRRCANPSMDTTAFPNPSAAGQFWGSTPRAELSSNAWALDINRAWVDQLGRTSLVAVRLVRKAP
jgi:hypothetical protein